MPSRLHLSVQAESFRGFGGDFLDVILFVVGGLMSTKHPRVPKSGGAYRALQAIKKFRSTQPSDKLVKTISEYEYEVNLRNPRQSWFRIVCIQDTLKE